MQRVNDWLRAMEVEILSVSNGTAVIFGASAQRLPSTSCIAMPGVSSETQLIRFDLEGIHVSAGSACSSGRIEPSHVLRAMGIAPEIAGTALRVSGGWNTMKADIETFTEVWKAFFKLRNPHERN
jgi:cysteine desulfurase